MRRAHLLGSTILSLFLGGCAARCSGDETQSKESTSSSHVPLSGQPSEPRNWEQVQQSKELRFLVHQQSVYNVGHGHVRDAQHLALERGLDPHQWFGHVAEAMLLLEKPAHARKARYGYCRGREPYTYVENIQASYDAYVEMVEP